MTITPAQLAACKTLEDLEALYPPRKLPKGAEVVRVAPSPTGKPHLGTAMQCTIDRALANQSGGRFILRIEDTDQKRLVEGAVQSIVDSIQWLGLNPDEGPHVGGDYGPYVQSERLPIYKIVADDLLKRGHAYRCFCTPERLDLMRKTHQQQGLLPGYDGLCRRLSQDTIDKKLAEGIPYVLRLKMPQDTTLQFTDLVRGPISFDASTQDDPVIMKSDGFPTYHLAAMTDDHFMRVTTIVRGEEWIPSTPKHMQVFEAMGWDTPKILHTVLLRDAQKRKLSKRSGDTSIEWFRGQGYMPAGFINFLTRVMWAHPDEKDIYSFDEFTQLMSTDQLPATGPVADFALLGFINGKYVAELGVDKFYDELVAYFERLIAIGDGLTLEIYNGEARDTIDYTHDHLVKFLAAMKRDVVYTKKVFALEPERIRRLADVLDQYGFFFNDLYTAPASEVVVKNAGGVDAAKAILQAYLDGLNLTETQEAWEVRMRAIADGVGQKVRAAFMTARLALTGLEKSPPVFDITKILGVDEARRRLEAVLKSL
jgi:glutamyl-tRNA synthetase